MKRVADYIIDKISEAGAAHIFMVTGRGILYLSDAVAKNDSIQGIPMMHEQSASYAAMSYAKARNGIGVCLVSTGCAATNAVTGALCAYQDNLPVIFISGQHMLRETTRYTNIPIRTYGSQEADIISLVQPITKYAVMVNDPQMMVYEMEKALYLANDGRKGPVWIDIPLNLQSALIEPEKQEHFVPEKHAETITEKDMEMVVSQLNMSRRPVLFIGGGASECGKEIKDISEQLRIPVVFSFSACDIYGSGNKYSMGAVGSLGAPRVGNFVLQNADCVLVIGSKMCSQTVGDAPEMVAREAWITVVDIDINEHTKKGIKIDHLITGDAKHFLLKLQNEQVNCRAEKWLKRCLHWKDIFSINNERFIQPDMETGKIDLYDFCMRISGQLNTKTAVITDAGLEELIVPSTIHYKDDQKCFFAAAQGAMGYAIPAIIGAHYGGYEDIVVVVGDGSIMMNIQELQLLKYHNIHAKIFVINNDMYAVIRARQKDLFRRRTIGNDDSDGVPIPDFQKLAYAFGLEYQQIENAEALEAGLEKALFEDDSLICEVMCKTEQQYFHTSFRKNDNGKLVRPPIEDMSPFMERKQFFSEMIVKPVEV